MNKQRYLKKSISVLVFTIPALIPLFVFWVYPICRSVWISFTDWDYMTPTYHFVFLKNYISLFKDTRFYEALLNTLIFTIGTLVPTIAIGLVLAVFANYAQTECQFRYCGTAIPFLTVRSTAR